MRVLLDVSAVPDQPVGAGVYIINLTRALAAGAEVRLELLARSGDRARWRDIAPTARVHAVVPSGRAMRLVFEQVGSARLARRLGIDVWHGPHYTLPLRLDPGVRRVVTIHDMTFFEHPEYHERVKVEFFQRMIRAAVEKADVLVAVSHDTADRVRSILAPRAPLTVAPHGVDRARFRPSARDETAAADLEALAAVGVRPPYLAFVGTLEPRKNVPGLIGAFNRIGGELTDLQLVLAGRPGWAIGDIRSAVTRSRHRDRIVSLGYVDVELLPSLYRQAAAVVYPSWAEGFGLPALEALACGAPLVTTSGTPMEEVAGDAAVLVTPGDEPGLAEAIRRVVTSDKLARGLREAGPRVAARYSWGLCARAHLDAYAAAVKGVAS